MYDWKDSSGAPIDRVYAQRRALNEPLTEITQVKGQSDTTPEISPTDEFSNFEIFDQILVPGAPKSAAHGSYIREAFGRGLEIAAKVGANPYRYGLVGATDIHDGLSTSDENAQMDSQGFDPASNSPDAQTVANILRPDPAALKTTLDVRQTGSGGLTGVWAEANTRPSIFAALKRKETFATSGPRITVRFFGGWAYDRDLLKRKDWAATAYAQGVPMGSDLRPRPGDAHGPRLAFWAGMDPNSGKLDRAQIIKVWLDGSKTYQEKIFDVALSDGRITDPKTDKAPPVGNTVDLHTATYRNSIGAAELGAVWEDPEFDPKMPAVYYLRILEIPTPRWSTILAVKNGLTVPDGMATTIQERAWSSPIWYTPAG